LSDADYAELEASGETVGEAKWHAVRELERLHPGLDRDCVTFEVLAEGERGLLGVGTSPARVLARATLPAETPGDSPTDGESPAAHLIRSVMERIAAELGAPARVDITEDDESIRASASAPPAEIGLLIGRNGRTIDAMQTIMAAIAQRALEGDARTVEVDAGGYRERRRARLVAAATRAAESVLATGHQVTLDPMTPAERRIVHTALQDVDGIATHSEGEEPERCVVVLPVLSAQA
jgi:spoIIIJ-associated protein